MNHPNSSLAVDLANKWDNARETARNIIAKVAISTNANTGRAKTAKDLKPFHLIPTIGYTV